MSKLYAVYTSSDNEERFLGQAYLSEKDLEAIEQSFSDQLQGEYFITLTDGDAVNVNFIDSIEEINSEEESD